MAKKKVDMQGDERKDWPGHWGLLGGGKVRKGVK